MNQEIKSLIDQHGIPPDGRLPLAAQRDAEAQREAHAQRARSRTRATAVAVGVVLASTAIYAAFDGAFGASLPSSYAATQAATLPAATLPAATTQMAAACAPAPTPKGYTALCPIETEKYPARRGWPRPLVADAHPAIVFYECWAGGPIVSDPKECPPKEHGGYR